MSGWVYAFGQNLVLLAVVAILGVLVGLLIERARAAGRGHTRPEPSPDADPETSGTTMPVAEPDTAEPVSAEQPEDQSDDRAQPHTGQARAAVGTPEEPEPTDPAEPTEPTEPTEPSKPASITESGDEQTPLRAENPGPRARPTPAVAPPGSRPVSDDRVAELQRKLDAARAHVDWLSAQMKEVEGHAAVEYGRLEAAALRALDETISADQLRIRRLQDELAKSQAEQSDYRQHLVVSEQRFESLRAALADRDVRIAELDNELKELRRHGVAQKVKEGPR